MFAAPITKAGRQFLGRLFPEIPLDLEGDGEADIFMPRHWAVYYGKNLLPSLILNIVAQVSDASSGCSHLDASAICRKQAAARSFLSDSSC